MEKMLGIDITRVTTTPLHEVGTIIEDPRGGSIGTLSFSDGFGGTITRTGNPGAEYRYVKAGAAIAAGDAVKVDNSGTDADKPGTVIPTSGVTDIVEGIAHVAIASGSYGFITTKGRVYAAKVTDGGAEGDALGASATAGTLVSITASSTVTQAEAIAAIRYAAGRRAMALVDVGTNIWDVVLRG